MFYFLEIFSGFGAGYLAYLKGWKLILSLKNNM